MPKYFTGENDFYADDEPSQEYSKPTSKSGLHFTSDDWESKQSLPMAQVSTLAESEAQNAKYNTPSVPSMPRIGMGDLKAVERDMPSYTPTPTPSSYYQSNAKAPVTDNKTFGESIKDTLKSIGGTIAKGVMMPIQGLANAESTIGQLSEKYIPKALQLNTYTGQESYPIKWDKISESMDSATEDVNKWMGYDNMSSAGKFVSDTASSIPQMALNFIPGVGQILFGVSAGGNYQHQAQQQGASLEQSALYGAIGGAAEVGLNKALDVVPGYKKLFEDAFSKGVTTQSLKQFSKEYIKQAVREGTEELAIDPVMGIAEKMIYNPDKNWTGDNGVFDIKQMGTDFLGGMLLSGLLESPAMANKIVTSLNKKNPGNPVNVEQLKETVNNKVATIEKTVASSPIGVNIPDSGVLPIKQDTGDSVILEKPDGTEAVIRKALINQNDIQPIITASESIAPKSSTVNEMSATNTNTLVENQESIKANNEELNYDANSDKINKIINEDMTDRKVKPLQEQFPDLKNHIQEEAGILLTEVENSYHPERYGVLGKDGEYTITSTRAKHHPDIDKLMSLPGATYEKISKALTDIMNGKSNYALAKKVELLINDRLTSGYNFMGEDIPSNVEYLKLKNKINGVEDKTETNEVNKNAGKDSSTQASTQRDSEVESTKEGKRKFNDTVKEIQKSNPSFRAEITSPTTNIQKDIQKHMKSLGINVHYYESSNGESIPDGIYREKYPDTIFIQKNLSNKNLMMHTAGHEFMHTVKNNHPEQFIKLLNFAEQYFTEEEQQSFLEDFKGNSYYDTLKNDHELLLEEMLSDELGNNFVNKDFWTRLAEHSKSLFAKLAEMAHNILSKISGNTYDTHIAKETSMKLTKEFENMIIDIVNSTTQNKIVGSGEAKLSARNKTEKEPDKYYGEDIVKFFNNSNRGQLALPKNKYQRDLIDLMEQLNTNLAFYKGEGLKGFYSPFLKNTIFVNSNNDNESALMETVGHEFMHRLRVDYPEDYKYLMDNAKSLISKAVIKDYVERYKDTEFDGISKESLLEEIIADEMGRSFTDYDFWYNIQEKTPNLFTKMMKVLNAIFNKVKTQISGNLAYDDFKKLQRNFETVVYNVKAKGKNDVKLSTRKKKELPPEFYNWFGDSKMVNEDGTPKVFYHGTGAKFNVFSTFQPPFFSGAKDFANEYTGKGGGKPTIMQVYLKMEKPFDTRDSKTLEVYNNEFLPFAKSKFDDGADRYQELKPGEKVPFTTTDALYNFLKRRNRSGINDYDGIIVDERIGNEDWSTSYVVLNPNQIKSVKNTGTFDVNNPDIRYSDKKERSHHKRYEEAEAVDKMITDNIVEANKKYIPETNQEQWDKGLKEAQSDSESAYAEVMSSDYLKTGYETAKAEATLFVLQQEAKTFDQMGLKDKAYAAWAKALDVAQHINELLTNAGRAVQAASIIKRLTPEGQLQYATKKINDSISEKDKKKLSEESKKAAEEMNKINSDGAEEVSKQLEDVENGFVFNELDERTKEIHAILDIVEKKHAKKIAKSVGESLDDLLNSLGIDESFDGTKLSVRNTGIDSLKARIEAIVEAHYETEFSKRGSLQDKFMRLGLSKDQAGKLAKSVNGKMQEITKDDKLKLVGKLDKKEPNPKKKREKPVEEVINREEPTPEEILSERIKSINSETEVTEPEKDAIKDMVNTLFKVYKEEYSDKEESKNMRDPFDFIFDAVENKDKYQEVWEKAQELVQEKFQDKPEILDSLQNYFGSFLDTPFAKSQLSKAAMTALDEAGVSISDMVTMDKVEINKVLKTINEKLNKYDATQEIIDEVNDYVKNEVMTKVGEARNKKVEAMFKPKTKSKNNPAEKILSDLYNMGAITDSRFQGEVSKKLQNLVKRVSKELKIDIKELIKKHYTEQNRAKESIKDALIKKGLDSSDAKVLNDYIEKAFEQVTREKKNQYIENFTKKIEPKKAKSFMDRILEISNMGAIKDKDLRAMVAAKYEIPFIDEVSASKIIDMATKLQEISDKNSREYRVQHNALEDYIDSLVKPNLLRKINSYQVMSLLVNSLSAIRNIAGNIVTAGVRSSDIAVRTGLDYVASKKDKTRLRTSTIVKPGEYWKGFIEGYKEIWKDFIENVDSRESQGKAELAHSRTFRVNENLKNIDPRKWVQIVLASGERVQRMLLDDRGFKFAAMYAEIARMKKVAKLNGVEFDETAAREIANLEGEYSTFNDSNIFTKSAAQVVRGLNGNKEWGFGSILFRFAKIPVNIAKFEIEHSPLVVAKVLVKSLRKSYTKDGLNGQTFIDDIAKGVTGTMAMAIGYLLMSLGVISLDDDKDMKNKNLRNLKDSARIKSFTFNFTALARVIRGESAEYQDGDNTFSYDWMNPASLLIITGAKFKEAKDTKSGQGVFTGIMDGMMESMNALMEQPLLSSVNQFKYAENPQDVGKIFASNVVSSMIPSVLNAARRTVDNNKRDVKSDNWLGQMGNSVKNRIPFASKSLPIIPDNFGNPQTYYNKTPENALDYIANAGASFLNPATHYKYKQDKTTELALGLYKLTNNTEQIPRMMKGEISVSSSEYVLPGNKKEMTVQLSKQELIDYQKSVGNEVKKKLGSIPINKSDPNKQVDEISSMLNKIQEDAKRALLLKKGIPHRVSNSK